MFLVPIGPLSKADNKPRCLAWHTKGMCNPGTCPWNSNHAEYSVDEYKPLTQWCAANYPK